MANRIALTSLLEDYDIEAHLASRGVDPTKTRVIMDKKSGVATFLLFNLSGKMVGYQEYNPREQKVRNNAGRYFTYIMGKKKEKEIGVWGTETITKSKNYLFLVEGIFDAVKVHNAGEPCIAMLGNASNKGIKSWFSILRKKLIVIYDDDQGGKQLRKYGHYSFTCPAPYNDLGDMPQNEVNDFIQSILRQV